MIVNSQGAFYTSMNIKSVEVTKSRGGRGGRGKIGDKVYYQGEKEEIGKKYM